MNFSHNAPEEDRILLEKISKALEKLRENDIHANGYEGDHFATVFILAKVISNVFGLRFAEGLYSESQKHCWVTTINGHIIDLYPIDIFGGPLLIDGCASHVCKHYIEREVSKFGMVFNFHINKAVNILL